MPKFTEKQLQNRLNKYYKAHFGENPDDEWHVNPAPNKWKFVRDGKTFVIVCDTHTGKVTEQ